MDNELWTKNYGYFKLVMKASFAEREIGIFFVDNEPKPSDALFVRHFLPSDRKRLKLIHTQADITRTKSWNLTFVTPDILQSTIDSRSTDQIGLNNFQWILQIKTTITLEFPPNFQNQNWWFKIKLCLIMFSIIENYIYFYIEQ